MVEETRPTSIKGKSKDDVAESGADESKDCGFCVGDYVRLHGLKAAFMNGQIGTVTEVIKPTGRFGVRLVASCESKAFLPQKLKTYHSDPNDKCPKCAKFINLRAFPACSCYGPEGDGNSLSSEFDLSYDGKSHLPSDASACAVVRGTSFARGSTTVYVHRFPSKDMHGFQS